MLKWEKSRASYIAVLWSGKLCNSLIFLIWKNLVAEACDGSAALLCARSASVSGVSLKSTDALYLVKLCFVSLQILCVPGNCAVCCVGRRHHAVVLCKG